MPTRMTLQLADCSITRPYGVIEDVLVKVKHLIFPVELDYGVYHKVAIDPWESCFVLRVLLCILVR